MAVAVALALSAATVWAQDDDLDREAVERGRHLFETTAGGVGCAICHGNFALGDLAIAPAIRGVDLATVTTALRNVPDMEFLDLTSAQLDDMVAYLAWLGAATPYRVAVRDRRFTPPEIEVVAGETLQLILDNADREEYTVRGDEPGDHVVPARAAADFVWQAPAEGGSFELELVDGMGDALATLTITTAGA